MVKCEAMMKLVIHCIDRVRRFKLGKEVSEDKKRVSYLLAFI